MIKINKTKFDYTVFGAISSIVVALSGLFVLIGWLFDITIFKTFGLSAVSMKPNSALAFLLAGFSILLLILKNTSKTSETVSKVLSIVIFLIGLLTSIEYLLHIQFGIDQILFKDVQNAFLTIIPGRMSFNLALGFVFTGIALLLVRKENILLNVSIIFTAAIGIIAVLGYVFNLPYFLQLLGINTIALNSAICLIILSVGIYFTKPNKGPERTKIELQTLVVFVVVAIFIITSDVISLNIQKRMTGLDKQVLHTIYVNENIEHLFLLAKDMESSSRGYVITGDEAFLELYYRAQSEFPRQIEGLRILIKDHTENQYIDSLNELIGKRISFDDGTISIRKATGLQPAIERITEGTGKLLMDNIRIVVEKMKSVEYRLYNDQDEEFLNMSNEAKLIQTLIIFIQFGFMIMIYFLIARDVKEHKKVETEQKTAESALRKFYLGVEQSPTSVVITNIKGDIEYVNPYFTEATGYSSKEAIGKNPRILKSNNKTKEEFKVLWDTILSGKSWRGDLLNKKKNDELFWESTTISPIKNTKGEITHFIAIKLDITEKKKLEEELIISRDKAEDLSRLKSNFLANMSHELRTPLIGILGYSDAISEDAKDETTIEMAGIINKGGKRLLETLNLILNLSSIEAGRLDLNKEVVDVDLVLNEVIELFTEVATGKNLYIKKAFCASETKIKTDQHILNHIFNNLLNNAIKYTKKGGVTVSTKNKDDGGKWIVVNFQDSGIGISKENQELIWEEFRQVSEGYSRAFEGNGLGLTITKNFVERLGGKIGVQSEIGIGSVFTIEIPIDEKTE